MKIFAVTYLYETASSELRAQRLAGHRAWLQEMEAQHRILGAGIFSDTSGSMLVVEAASAEEIEHALTRDPFVKTPGIAQVQVKEWTPTWGLLANPISS